MSEERLRGLVESGPRNALAILAALNSRGATGSLRFEPGPDPENMVEFLFRDGKLLFASTNRPGERLGEYLVRRNLLTARQATTALLDARRHGELFHAYLVVRGFLDPKIMPLLLYERTEELLHDILQSKEGRFVFEPVSLKLLQRLGPTVDEELFARLLTFRNLWPHAYETLWVGRPILRWRPDARALLHSEELSEVQRQALDVIDGQRTVQRLLEGRKDRIELSICLVQFLKDGLLEIIARDARPRATSLPVDPNSAQRHSEPAGTPAAKAPPSPSQRQDASGAPAVDLDAIPVMTSGTQLANISSVGLTMDDLFALTQIDGKTSLRQLISITGIHEKQLYGLVHHLAGLGYVELRDQPVPGPPVRSMRKPSRVTAVGPGTQTPAPARGPERDFQPTAVPMPGPPPAPRAPAAASAPTEAKKAAEPQPAPKAPAAASAPVDPLGPAERLHEHAVTAYNTQRFSVAEDLLRKALDLDAEASVIRAHLALAMSERPDQMEAAWDMAHEAYEEDPLESRCYEVMGYLKLKRGLYDKAKPLLERALLLDKKKSRSSARVLEELKNEPPGKGQKPEDIWPRLRKHIRLSR